MFKDCIPVSSLVGCITELLPKGVLGHCGTHQGFLKANWVQCLKRQNWAEPGLSLPSGVTGMRMKATSALPQRMSLWCSRR